MCAYKLNIPNNIILLYALCGQALWLWSGFSKDAKHYVVILLRALGFLLLRLFTDDDVWRRRDREGNLWISTAWGGDVNGGLDNSGGYHGESEEGYDDIVDGSGDDLGGDECGNKMEMTMVFMM